MDVATAIKIAKEAGKMAQKAKELYELDQKKRIIVKQNIILGRFHQALNFPDGSIRSVPDFLCDDFGIIDGVFEVFATDDREPIIDGSSLAPDKIGSWNTIKAAIGHDCGYEHLEEMAEAWGWKVEDVRWLLDAMFGNLLEAETARQQTQVMRVAGGVFTRIYFWAVRRFGGIYHDVKKVAPALLAVLLIGGCLAIPDVFEPSDEQPEVEEAQAAALDAGAFGCGNWKGSASTAPTATETSDAVDFSSLDWCWGGFKGGSAKAVDGVEIASLKVSDSGLTYKWVAGGCEKLGASSSTDYSQTLACFFCKIDGKWKGGKIDWISTSRTSRDFKNIEEGYNGWDRQAVGKADMFAFCIVSKDGKKRTNMITAAK